MSPDSPVSERFELVFTRPEIGVYILLSGDSDFSSLVLGKMQERLARSTSIDDLPRFGGFDHQALREMRREAAAEEPSRMAETQGG